MGASWGLGTSTARRKSKGASALGGSADLKQLAFKSQKSKGLWNKLFRTFQWSAYLRPAVLGTGDWGIVVFFANAPCPITNALASRHHCRHQHPINNMDHAIVCQNICFEDIGVIYLKFAVGRFNGYN